MRKSLLAISIILLFVNCISKVNTEVSILSLIPESSALVIKINDFNTLNKELSSNKIISELKSTRTYKKVSSLIKPLSYLENQKEGVLAFSQKDSSQVDFAFISRDSIFFNDNTLKKITNNTTQLSNYKNLEIRSYTFNEHFFYIGLINGNTILSSSESLLKTIYNQRNHEISRPSLEKFFTILSPDKPLNIWVDFKNGKSLLSHLTYDDHKFNDLANSMSLDVSIHNSELLLSGIAVPDSTSHQVLNLLSKTRPVENSLAEIAPLSSNSLKSYSLSDFKKFALHPKQPIQVKDSLLNTVEEIGVADIEKNNILYLKTYGTESLLDYLNQEKSSSEEFGSSIIWELKPDMNFFELMSPLIGNHKFRYGSLIENTFLFATSKKTLEFALISYKNGNVFHQSPLFYNTQESSSTNASISTVANFKGLKTLIRNEISEKLSNGISKTKLDNYVFGSQFIVDNNFFHTRFFIKNKTKQSIKNSVSQVFGVEFKTDLATLPQFVSNHNNRKKEIIVQDQDNILYLISTKGNILWEKQLEGTIQGKIVQVDLYKNGKLQYAFTTNNQFLILDRNGNEVEPFTIKYKDGNLNPLAVFDYEDKKDYRFVVTQNKNIFMYDNKAKIVKGFTYKKAKADILMSPKHFRIGKKDYITFPLANGLLKIVNRVGKERVKTKEKFLFTENGIFAYQNKFTFTSTDGYLNQIDTKGKVFKTNLNLAKDHGIDATSKTLVVMNDNILSIRNKKVELELGVYTKPSIFYLNDKIYVSVTDLQNQKNYLFDSQAKSIPNFPIHGSSAIDMADIDNNKRPELVFKDQDNAIKVFKIQ